MNLKEYLKDKLFFLFSQAVIILLIGLLCSVLHIGTFAILLFAFVILLIIISSLVYDFTKRSHYYNRIYHILNAMDKKQYISQLIDEPDFADAKIIYDILKQTTKSMNDEIATYQIADKEYKEYIETWIHEIKLPISCINLICENNKNEVTKNIDEEMQKIDGYVEQALYYARSSNLEKDYLIRTITLTDSIKDVVKKHSKQLIAFKAYVKLENLDYIVYSDRKWLDFILGQIVSNSIKYKKDKLVIKFSAEEFKQNITLSIQDNGLGIPSKDITKIFDKSFTGENGRRFSKSTGIGLYLCKKLCDKMHLGLELSSVINEGTTVKIIFPKDKSLLFE